MQEAVLTALSKDSCGEEPESYFAGIIATKAHDLARAISNKEETLRVKYAPSIESDNSHHSHIETELSQREHKEIERWILMLSPEEQRVVRLWLRAEDYSFAKELGITTAAAKSRLFRALRKLRRFRKKFAK